MSRIGRVAAKQLGRQQPRLLSNVDHVFGSTVFSGDRFVFVDLQRDKRMLAGDSVLGDIRPSLPNRAK